MTLDVPVHSWCSQLFFNFVTEYTMSLSPVTKAKLRRELVNVEMDISYLQRDLQARYEAEKIMDEIRELENNRQMILNELMSK